MLSFQTYAAPTTAISLFLLYVLGQPASSVAQIDGLINAVPTQCDENVAKVAACVEGNQECQTGCAGPLSSLAVPFDGGECNSIQTAWTTFSRCCPVPSPYNAEADCVGLLKSIMDCSVQFVCSSEIVLEPAPAPAPVPEETAVTGGASATSEWGGEEKSSGMTPLGKLLGGALSTDVMTAIGDPAGFPGCEDQFTAMWECVGNPLNVISCASCIKDAGDKFPASGGDQCKAAETVFCALKKCCPECQAKIEAFVECVNEDNKVSENAQECDIVCESPEDNSGGLYPRVAFALSSTMVGLGFIGAQG
uniref:Uncharacterized protein n=1 Tax=Trieres chinensis TaxID=1514140 RepID=A0A7S1ZHX7_TRICV|mmetsp:Transcript_25727/g.52675  ORF Transcript_25727/g.52675 Transcript_25727/m.52675 type:complete len:307 (+) Transcript_25727:79-999(+)